jgi:hypothetical protein
VQVLLREFIDHGARACHAPSAGSTGAGSGRVAQVTSCPPPGAPAGAGPGLD